MAISIRADGEKMREAFAKLGAAMGAMAPAIRKELDVARDAILRAGWQLRNIEQRGFANHFVLLLVAPGEFDPHAVFEVWIADDVASGAWLAEIPERGRASLEADGIEETMRGAARAVGLGDAVRGMRKFAGAAGISEAAEIALCRLEAELR